MPPKRKSDVLESVADTQLAASGSVATPVEAGPSAKKARVADAGEGSSKATKKGKAAAVAQDWREIELEDEGDGVPVYDDCNEIRRKIRELQKTPGFKVTHWLRDIGNINSNSMNRFMKASGPTGGAGNGLYYAAYVYFEKIRIATGKKKTPKRQRNESENPNGFPLEERRGMWVFTGKR